MKIQLRRKITAPPSEAQDRHSANFSRTSSPCMSAGRITDSLSTRSNIDRADLAVSDKSLKKLDAYQIKRPLTHGRKLPAEKASDPELQRQMPGETIGKCWGGSVMRQGAALHVSHLLRNPNASREEILSLVADTYLLSTKQAITCMSFTLSKLIFLPVALLPLEGTVNALQTRSLMGEILRENNISKGAIEQLNFNEMDCKDKWFTSSDDVTPTRNLTTRGVLPRNTEKTRRHLESVSGSNAALTDILNDRNNYIPRSLAKTGSTEGAVLSQAGWQKIISNVLFSN